MPVKIRNLFNKLRTGEKIAFNRGDFVKQATNLFNSQQKTQEKLVNQFTKRSQRLGINPADVVTPIDVADPNQLQDQLQDQVTTPTTQADFDAIPSGTVFIDTDGVRKVKQ